MAAPEDHSTALMAEELDAEQLSELPEEILNHVLRRLPLSSLCRFRAVSKHWNTLPTVRPEDPYLLEFPRQLSPSLLRHCSLYSPITNKWDVLDLSFLGLRMVQLCSLPNAWFPQTKRFCSDGGLLCLRGQFFQRARRSDHSLFVCNPLTRSCKLLPSSGFEDETLIDLVMHRESSGVYKIFAITLTYRGLFLLLRHFMYDSASESWKPILDLHRDCGNVNLLRYCSVVFEGVYYCVSGGDRQAYEIYAYDIEQDSWVAAGVKMELDPKTQQVLFVVSNERLLLIASIFEKKLWRFRISRVDLCRMDDSAVCCFSSSEVFLSQMCVCTCIQGLHSFGFKLQGHGSSRSSFRSERVEAHHCHAHIRMVQVWYEHGKGQF